MKLKSILSGYFILHFALIIIGLFSPNIGFTLVLGFLACFFFSLIWIRIGADGHSSAKILLILILMRLALLGGYDLYLTLTEQASLPFLIIHLLGIVSGFLYINLAGKLRFVLFVCSSIFVVFMVTAGEDYWLHKINFGTFTGKVEAYKLPSKFEAFDETFNLITDSKFQNKIVLLDFWHTRCGVCFAKFPQVQSAYNQFHNDPEVLIYAVNKPIEEDSPTQAFEVIKEKGYSFPVLIASDPELPEKLGVYGYPTTFVINPLGMVVFKGDIEGAVRAVSEMKPGEHLGN